MKVTQAIENEVFWDMRLNLSLQKIKMALYTKSSLAEECAMKIDRRSIRVSEGDFE